MTAEVTHSTTASGVRGLCLRSRFEHELVHIAPAPVFAGLEALHYWVSGSPEVLGRVLIGRRVATADVAAAKTEPKVYPPAPGLEAFFAALGGVRADGPYLAQMGALHDRASSWRSRAWRSHPPRSAPAS